MITPRIKPSAFFARGAATDLFVQEQREGKLGSYVAKLVAVDGLIDFAAVAAQVDQACPPRPWCAWPSCRRPSPRFAATSAKRSTKTRWKLIRRIEVMPANVDDGQILDAVLDTANTRARLLADRGYDSAANRKLLDRHGLSDGIARRAKPGQQAHQLRPNTHPERAQSAFCRGASAQTACNSGAEQLRRHFKRSARHGRAYSAQRNVGKRGSEKCSFGIKTLVHTNTKTKG